MTTTGLAQSGGLGGNILNTTGRFKLANAPPEVRDAYVARITKQEALKSDLAVQMEEKRRRKALEKQRQLEIERREDERVRREQEEIRTQYQIEHRAAQKKEQDLAEANRIAAEESKARAEAARKNAADVMAMPNPKRDDAFSPKRSAMRTPPPVGGYPPPVSGGGSSGSGRSGGRGNSGHGMMLTGETYGGRREQGSSMTMTQLRRDLNDQHGALLRELNSQRETVMELRSQIEMFANGVVGGGSAGGGVRYGSNAYSGGGMNGSAGSHNSQNLNLYGQSGLQPAMPGGGTGFMQNIDMDDPDQLDNLLLEFVNKKGIYNPTAQMPTF